MATTFSELGIKFTPVSGRTRYSVICPHCNNTRQHHKNSPCLTVNDEPGNRWFKCHHVHCGWSGNLEDMEQYAKVQEKSKMPKQIADTYSKEVREYWQSRGIDIKIPLKHKVYEFSRRSAEGSKPILGFPTYIGYTLVDAKFLDIRWKAGQDSPKWWNIKKEDGSRTLPWGLEDLNFPPDEKKIIIWTEGHVDRLTWIQAGYKNVLSVPSGAPNPDAKNFDHEFDYINDPYTKSKIADADLHVFSTDNDAPGIKLKNHLALIIGKERCKYIQYPVGYKDINEVWAGDKKKGLKALNQEGVDDCYQNLSSFPVGGIIKPSMCREELEMIVKNGFTPGLGIGIPEVDRLFTLKPKHLTVITGLPSAGKSTFIRWYICELIRHNEKLNLKFALFTPENVPEAREFAKIAEVWTGQFYREGWKNSMSKELRDKTMRYIEKHFFIISPNSKNFESWNGKIKSDKVNTMESILEYLKYLKKTENIFGYVIDAWNKIEHEQPRNMTESTFISRQLDYLINFNDAYDVHGVIIAHPTKIEKVGINYRMPCLYDIKGSSAWKEKPDTGIILHRYMNRKKPNDEIPDDADEDDKYYVDSDVPTILRTEKIRFEEEGKMDKTKLKMDSAKGGRFYVWEEKKKNAPVVGKLNPAAKDDDDDTFNGKEDNSDLPF